MDKETYMKIMGYVPTVIEALLLLLIAFLCATLVKALVKKTLTLVKIDEIKVDDKSKINLSDFFAKIFYLLTFALFVPGIFDKLGLTRIGQPIVSMMDKFLSYLPNIMAAIIILVIGLCIAKIVRDILIPVFKSLNVDKYVEKLGVKQDSKATVSEVLGNLVYALILIPVVIAALDSLKIEAISKPATEMLNNILVFIPRIAITIAIVFVGKFIATLAGELLEKLLISIGTDTATANLIKASGTKTDKEFSLSGIIAGVVKYVIIIFFLVEGLNILQLEVLTNVGNKIISYMPYAISSAIILGIAILTGNFAENSINKKFTDSKVTALIVKLVIIVIGAFITLYQLGIAASLVQSAFIIVLGAFAVAFAIAFGVGGREFASNMLKKLEKRIDNKKTK